MSNDLLHSRFSLPFYWTFWSSLIYEGLKLVHLVAAARVMDGVSYGIMATLFASLYMATDLADLGASHTLPAVSGSMLATRQRATRLLLWYYALPSGLAAVLGAGLLIVMYYHWMQIPLDYFLTVSVCFLVLGETARVFLRMLLRACFKTQQTVLLELGLFLGYVSSIWLYYAVHGKLSLHIFFAAHVLDSACALAGFFYLLGGWYKQLPIDDQAAGLPLPQPVALYNKQVLVNRTSNYILRLTRRMFTSNFLTPLFALRFGLGNAGCFYVASSFASSLHAVMRYSVAHSGAAYLASLVDQSLAVKRQAFIAMSKRLFGVLIPQVVFLLASYKALVVLLHQYTGASAASVSLALVFILVTFIDFFFMLYEQFYVVESSSLSLLFARLSEVAAFYLIFTASTTYAPVLVLVALVIIRTFFCGLLAAKAFGRWGIVPSIAIDPVYGAVCFLVALGLNFIAFWW